LDAVAGAPELSGWIELVGFVDIDIAAATRLGTYTNFVNLLDMCAIAVPTGPVPMVAPEALP
jgi:hypothetical protein